MHDPTTSSLCVYDWNDIIQRHCLLVSKSFGRSSLCPIFRANSFPEVMNPFLRLPLSCSRTLGNLCCLLQLVSKDVAPTELHSQLLYCYCRRWMPSAQWSSHRCWGSSCGWQMMMMRPSALRPPQPHASWPAPAATRSALWCSQTRSDAPCCSTAKCVSHILSILFSLSSPGRHDVPVSTRSIMLEGTSVDRSGSVFEICIVACECWESSFPICEVLPISSVVSMPYCVNCSYIIVLVIELILLGNRWPRR